MVRENSGDFKKNKAYGTNRTNGRYGRLSRNDNRSAVGAVFLSTAINADGMQNKVRECTRIPHGV